MGIRIGGRKSKYRNKRTVVGGLTFDSKKEAARWVTLLAMRQSGKIDSLRRQVNFSIEVNGFKICQYRADFVYIEDGEQVVEDAKGFRTDVYKIKKKLMLAVCNIDIRES